MSSFFGVATCRLSLCKSFLTLSSISALCVQSFLNSPIAPLLYGRHNNKHTYACVRACVCAYLDLRFGVHLQKRDSEQFTASLPIFARGGSPRQGNCSFVMLISLCLCDCKVCYRCDWDWDWPGLVLACPALPWRLLDTLLSHAANLQPPPAPFGLAYYLSL